MKNIKRKIRLFFAVRIPREGRCKAITPGADLSRLYKMEPNDKEKVTGYPVVMAARKLIISRSAGVVHILPADPESPSAFVFVAGENDEPFSYWDVEPKFPIKFYPCGVSSHHPSIISDRDPASGDVPEGATIQ